jgi:hypothetical protein
MLYLVPVELVLNLAWLTFSAATLVAWMRWRRCSAEDPVPLARGLVIVVCILVLLLPAISISDDLAQTPALAEGVKLQDTLAAPESLVSPGTIPAGLLFASLNPFESKATFLVQPESRAFPPELYWIPAVEKRPPPISA